MYYDNHDIINYSARLLITYICKLMGNNWRSSAPIEFIGLRSFLFIRIYFIRTSRLKFAKSLEFFKNQPEAENLTIKKIILCVENRYIQYNYMFLTKPYKILPFSKRQN